VVRGGGFASCAPLYPTVIVPDYSLTTVMATKHNSVSLVKAGDTEPIFVLRAQDTLAAAVVRFWADEAEKAGANAAKIAEAREVADAMEQWPTRKIPD
jgi:hypothetical protein